MNDKRGANPLRNSAHPKEKVALLLQGGGALGAYQAGAYEALDAAGHRPAWVAGISIGAINAAIIAGNSPENVVPRLREFWMRVSSSVTMFPMLEEMLETAFSQNAATTTLMFGAPGFFKPRSVPPFGSSPVAPADLSYYDTSELKATLEGLVEFERINEKVAGRTRLSIGAVELLSGNFSYFDNDKERIGAEHVMASGALPPGLPPIEIDGRYYWDGGLVSNTPLQYVIDEDGRDDILAFQIDLFSARGPMPRNLFDVAEREKDIRFSSRTRLNTDVIKRRQSMAQAAMRLAKKVSAELRTDPDLAYLIEQASVPSMTLVHLIYKSKHDQHSFSKDYEFSRASIETHWAAGKADVEATFAHPSWRNRLAPARGEVKVLDLLDVPADISKSEVT